MKKEEITFFKKPISTGFLSLFACSSSDGSAHFTTCPSSRYPRSLKLQLCYHVTPLSVRFTHLYKGAPKPFSLCLRLHKLSEGKHSLTFSHKSSHGNLAPLGAGGQALEQRFAAGVGSLSTSHFPRPQAIPPV